MYPTAAAANNYQAFKGYGSFGDISYSLASNDYIGENGITVGDSIALNLNPGAGVCFDNFASDFAKLVPHVLFGYLCLGKHHRLVNHVWWSIYDSVGAG